MQDPGDIEDFMPDYTEVVEQNQSDSLGTYSLGGIRPGRSQEIEETQLIHDHHQ